MNKFVMLTVPTYSSGAIIDEKIWVNLNQISEIVPHDVAACRGDGDGWNSEITMTNGKRYHLVETPERVIELISAVELG